jgi:hypothetical protein
MHVNWEAIGAIGEVVGAVAVVITLLLLLSQLRQNTKALEASRSAEISQLYQFRAQMHMDGVLRRAEATGLLLPDVLKRMREKGVEALDPSERIFLVFHATADAVRLDNGLFQYENGFLDDEYVDYIQRSIRLLASHWKQIGLFELSTFRQGFVDEVRRLSASDT